MRPQDSLTPQQQQRAAVLPTALYKENAELKAELLKLYEREVRLLKHVDKRDKQLEELTGPKAAGAAKHVTQPKAVVQKVSESGTAIRPDAKQELQLKQLTKDLENLQKRYNALKNSKLGRIQLWYWRRRAGK